MSGVFQVARTFFDHPAFAPERFTEREAWMWLIGNCVWEPKRIRVGNCVVNLERGQCAFSLRFMASRWMWSEPKVRRFLNRLKTDAMVLVDTTQQVTQITVCNYDKYQFGRRGDVSPNDAASDAAPTQHRRKEKELKNLKTDVDDGGGGKLVSDSAFEIATEIGKLCGFNGPLDWPPQWAGAPMRVQTWLNTGWPREMILAASTEAVGKKRDGPPSSINYFEKPIASFIARQAAPMPKVEIVKQEVVHVVQGSGNANSGNVIDAQRRLVERLDRLGPVRAEICSGAGADPVRLLPKGGRERPGDVHDRNHRNSGGISRGNSGACDGPTDGASPEVELPSDCG